MAFSLKPKLAISLLLSLMFMSAFSAEAACCGRQKRNSTTTITGYFPNNTLQNGTFSYFSDGIFTQPNLNSTRKTLWRGAVVRTSPNNFYVVGEYSNVTDDFGNRYSGVFPEYGAWNQSSSVSQVRVASGTGDFSNVTGNSYYRPYSRLFWQILVVLVRPEPEILRSESNSQNWALKS
ncbi:hypothetical protein ACLB2K_069974 [Fragaria x ananassa]